MLLSSCERQADQQQISSVLSSCEQQTDQQQISRSAVVARQWQLVSGELSGLFILGRSYYPP